MLQFYPMKNIHSFHWRSKAIEEWPDGTFLARISINHALTSRLIIFAMQRWWWFPKHRFKYIQPSSSSFFCRKYAALTTSLPLSIVTDITHFTSLHSWIRSNNTGDHASPVCGVLKRRKSKTVPCKAQVLQIKWRVISILALINPLVPIICFQGNHVVLQI